MGLRAQQAGVQAPGKGWYTGHDGVAERRRLDVVLVDEGRRLRVHVTGGAQGADVVAAGVVAVGIPLVDGHYDPHAAQGRPLAGADPHFGDTAVTRHKDHAQRRPRRPALGSHAPRLRLLQAAGVAPAAPRAAEDAHHLAGRHPAVTSGLPARRSARLLQQHVILKVLPRGNNRLRRRVVVTATTTGRLRTAQRRLCRRVGMRLGSAPAAAACTAASRPPLGLGQELHHHGIAVHAPVHILPAVHKHQGVRASSAGRPSSSACRRQQRHDARPRVEAAAAEGALDESAACQAGGDVMHGQVVCKHA